MEIYFKLQVSFGICPYVISHYLLFIINSCLLEYIFGKTYKVSFLY